MRLRALESQLAEHNLAEAEAKSQQALVALGFQKDLQELTKSVAFLNTILMWIGAGLGTLILGRVGEILFNIKLGVLS